MSEYIIETKNLSQQFHVNRGYTVQALQDVSFGVKEGEVFGLVGETGCGKSTLARVVAGIYKPSEGVVYYRGNPVTGKQASSEAVKTRQEEMQIIFQDNAAALNPHMTVEELILEPLRIRYGKSGVEGAEKKLEERMEDVSLSSDQRRKHPAEISGGQRQRVAIARSLMTDPKIIIADEPVASLVISIQAQIINLFQKLQKEKRFSLLFIAHDLSVIRFISDRVGVMVQGRLVEMAPTKELFSNPRHPYTKTLISSMHMPDPVYERKRTLQEYENYQDPGQEWIEIVSDHFVLK